MRAPPSLSRLPYYPVTGGLGLLSLVASLAAFYNRPSVEVFDMNYLALHREPWRMLTSCFIHANWIHLGFNLAWLWPFGTCIEERFGPLRTATLAILVGVISSAAQYAFQAGGVGLSGIIYGFFGFLWVMSYHDTRLRGEIDPRTAKLLVGWFFACIVLTLTKILPVANYAHGAGMAMGVLIAFASVGPIRRRIGAALAVILMIAGTGWAATFGRRTVNFSADAGADTAHLALVALERDDVETAIFYYKIATSFRHVDSGWWYNLGVAYQKISREKMLDAFRHSLAIDPTDAAGKGQALESIGEKELEAGHFDTAAKYFDQAVAAAKRYGFADQREIEAWQALAQGLRKK